MTTIQVGPLDSLAGRGQFWGRLHKLTPPRRLELLRWACTRSRPGMMVPEPGMEMREKCRKALSSPEMDCYFTSEVYTDLSSLAVHWGVNLEDVAVRLDLMLSGKL